MSPIPVFTAGSIAMNRMLCLVMAVILTTAAAIPARAWIGTNGAMRDAADIDRPIAAACALEVPPRSE